MKIRSVRFQYAAIAILGVSGIATAAVGLASSPSSEQLRSALAARLPRTQVSAVNCDTAVGLCEVVAGDQLFYTDRSGRYLVIGRVYDMEARQDLTAARLLEINPSTLVGGAARANAEGDSPAGGESALAGGQRPAAARPAAAQRVDVSGLSQRGAIVWGSGPKRITVFSDFQCGYCRVLSQNLARMNVTVVERPISILGSRALSEGVLCSSDKVRALHAAYAGQQPQNAARCDTTGLDENEQFARTHGFGGTPVIVRSDGAVIEGFRPAAELQRWIGEAR